jgi:hypothetical protein
VTSKQAFELIFGQYGVNDAGIKIWEAAVNWERREIESVVKNYRARNSLNVARKTAAQAILTSIKRRDKKC